MLQDGDPFIYAGAIIDVYSHFDKSKIYGENARKRALVRHDAERIGKQLLMAYNKIISDFRK